MIMGARRMAHGKKAENFKNEYRITNVEFRVKLLFNKLFVILRAGGESRKSLKPLDPPVKPGDDGCGCKGYCRGAMHCTREAPSNFLPLLGGGWEGVSWNIENETPP
jgi:hypothetical protein